MPPKKSIFRGPDAQHFQLVHRSVRDPLINDPDASQQVLKAMGRANEGGKIGTTMADLAATVGKNMRDNEGEAAGYGILYDDSAYDYMQHLKPVGEDGFDSVLLSAPRGSGVASGMKGPKTKSKGKEKAVDDMFQLPHEVLPSKYEMSVADVRESQQAVPTELQGLQPDMDPHLRQVLEALDDDAFVDEEEGDVFDELLESGEAYYSDEHEDFEFAEWGLTDDGKPIDPAVAQKDEDDDDAKTENGEESWEDRFRAFKAAGGRPAPVSNGGWDSDEGAKVDGSEAADTIGSLSSQFKDMLVRGGKKRKGKRGPSDASGMSMSSASVYRNSGLRNLDDRFDAIEREYELDDDDDEWLGDDDDDNVSMAPSYMSSASRVSMFSSAARPDFDGEAPPLVEREDFDAIMDDFLENYEVVGNRMRPAMGNTGLSGPEKLKVLRAALEDGEGGGIGHEENRRRILEIERLGRSGKVREERDLMAMEEVKTDKDKWDVETILSTYTNTENHPGTIRVRSSVEAKARAERRAAAAEARERAAAAAARVDEESEDDSGSETERETPRVTVARPKGESAAERKARKAAVKADRAGRRAEKKAHTQTFDNERKRQIATAAKSVAGGRAADVSVTRGVIRM